MLLLNILLRKRVYPNICYCSQVKMFHNRRKEATVFVRDLRNPLLQQHIIVLYFSRAMQNKSDINKYVFVIPGPKFTTTNRLTPPVL